jgi:predicted aspartyl protease
MVRAKDNHMGRFSVEVELANFEDVVRAKGTGQAVAREKIRGVVDSGATRLVIPEAVAKRLGLEIEGKTKVRYADGRTATRSIARAVQLTCLGRDGIFKAIIEPGRESVLLGAIVMEDLDFVIDCASQQLRPRDPKMIVSEIE